MVITPTVPQGNIDHSFSYLAIVGIKHCSLLCSSGHIRVSFRLHYCDVLEELLRGFILRSFFASAFFLTQQTCTHKLPVVIQGFGWKGGVLHSWLYVTITIEGRPLRLCTHTYTHPHT